jgi:Ran GTPase-activating protein 1
MPETNSGIHFELDASVREALTPGRAEELLASLPEGVTSVKLGGKSFGDGSAEVASAALAQVAATLRILDISDIIASRPEDEAKRALAIIARGLTDAKSLVAIDLSDNAFGLKGIREVQSIIAGQPALESLKLCNNGLAADAGAVIASALTQQIPTKLKLLHFHNNLLESAGAIALAPIVEVSPHLEDFRFSALRLHHDGASRICDALACVPENLRILNLSDNNFGEAGGKSLAAVLLKTRNVEELVLRDTALCDSGVSAVCGAIAEGAGRCAQQVPARLSRVAGAFDRRQRTR